MKFNKDIMKITNCPEIIKQYHLLFNKLSDSYGENMLKREDFDDICTNLLATSLPILRTIIESEYNNFKYHINKALQLSNELNEILDYIHIEEDDN